MNPISNQTDVDKRIEEILYDYWAKHRDCKDGCQHQFKGEDTVEALKELIVEARIDELKELPAYKYGSWQAMTNEWIDARIKELQSKKIKE